MTRHMPRSRRESFDSKKIAEKLLQAERIIAADAMKRHGLAAGLDEAAINQLWSNHVWHVGNTVAAWRRFADLIPALVKQAAAGGAA